MGGSSSSKRQTTNTTQNYQVTDQSYRSVEIDNDAVDSSFRFAERVSDNTADNVALAIEGNISGTEAALDFSSDTVDKALRFAGDANAAPLAVVSDVADQALTFASNLTKTATNPDGQTAKYALIGAGLIGAAMVLKK